jgi:hypothetical protein
VSTATQATPVAWVGRWPRIAAVPLLVVSLLAALLVYIAVARGHSGPVTVDTPFPHDAAMERATGVQFSRVAVVGDGGLVMVKYVVLDVEKATAFQADRAHVPTVASQTRDKATNRVSIMKPGHLIRAGQTYYFVYQNTDGALRSGERATLTYLGHTLSDVPVL